MESIVLAYLAGMGVVALAFFVVGAFPEPPWVWGREYRTVTKERDDLRRLAERSVRRLEATDDTLETASQTYQTALRRSLTAGMSESELKTLCFELNIVWEDLPGDTREAKVTELVLHMARRGRTGELTNHLRIHRPDLWVRT